MKLSNFTSLDPSETERGIVGLQGASKLDREIWEEFSSNRNELAAESECLIDEVLDSAPTPQDEVESASQPEGPTEKVMVAKARLQQRFFRKAVLSSYRERCCVSGLPVPAVLRASHIVPWAESEEHRTNPRNGLCLAATYDAAFDRGLISFDDNLCLILSDDLKAKSEDNEVDQVFIQSEGKQIYMPQKNLPHPDLIARHRKRWGYSC